MKTTKRILSIFFAALLLSGIAAPAVHAAPGNDINITTIGAEVGIFEYENGYPWVRGKNR